MPLTKVTVALIPHEGFARAAVTLDEVVATIGTDIPLVVVEAGAPGGFRRHVDEVASRHPLTRLGGARYLTPNEARNLAFTTVATEYVAFVDNDMHLVDDWLGPLVACADETGAWAVNPLIAEFDDPPLVHIAGGVNRILEQSGRRVFEDVPAHANEPVALVRPMLQRQQTEMLEFHCMLVRSDALRRVGPLDEDLQSAWEHSDLCLAIHAAGAETWFEPGSYVVIVRTYDRANLMQSVLRWSPAWNRHSARHFAHKHGLADRRVQRSTYRFIEHRRYRAFCDATGLPAPFALLANPLAAIAVRRDDRARRRSVR